MVRMELHNLGGLKFEAVHTPSGTTLKTAAPKDNQGDGSSFSPTDLTATSLGACMATIMSIVANRHNWDLSGLKVCVDKEMVADPHRRIGKLTVQFTCLTEVPEEGQKILEKAALTCPVAQSLHPKVEILAEFDWRGKKRRYQSEVLLA